MKIIKNRNLIPWFRAAIWIFGFLILFASFSFAEGVLMYLGAVTGFFIAAIGGYAEKANALHLRPFDSSYENARESYKKL
jgi:hypothetical protein